MADTTNETIRGGWVRAAWAALLSLAIPGLGQIYARSWRVGVLLFAISTLPTAGCLWLTRAMLPTPPIVSITFYLVGLEVAIKIGAAIDAVRRTRRNPNRTRPHWAQSTWFAALFVTLLLPGAGIVIPFGWAMYSIPSGSNIPTLIPGDYVMTDKSGPDGAPTRGDVVVFKYPRDPSVTYVKRVIGLPGDRVSLKNGQLYINGQIVPRQPAGEFVSDDSEVRVSLRHYIETLPNGRSYSILKATDQGMMNNTQDYLVPAGRYFVLGDNRDNSADSRFANSVGYVPQQNLIGKAWTIFWSRTPGRILGRVE
jgi:signal peptidase I